MGWIMFLLGLRGLAFGATIQTTFVTALSAVPLREIAHIIEEARTISLGDDEGMVDGRSGWFAGILTSVRTDRHAHSIVPDTSRELGDPLGAAGLPGSVRNRVHGYEVDVGEVATQQT